MSVEHARLLTRKQLELEEACRYRDLLLNEGGAATASEIEEANARVRLAKDGFMQLKSGHSVLIEKANVLGRCGYPEVWRNISYSTRGGALLTLESFQNVRVLKAPHVFVGERDGRQHVLKARLVGNDKAAMRSFEKELFVLKRLRHPLIIHMTASFRQDDKCFLVLPFFPDGTLRDWLDRHPEPSPVALKNYFRGVAQALTFLHNNSVIHGDCKLENILLDGDKPVLADFDTASDSSFFDSTVTSQMAPGTLL